MNGNFAGIIIGVIAGAVFIFLICRELVCWYWKINRIVALMEEQNSLLKSLVGGKAITTDGSNDKPIVEQLKEGIINNGGDNTGNIKLIVERGNNVIYSALSLDIFIDKKHAFSIENESKIIHFVENGPHTIYASIDYTTQSEIINFTTDNSAIAFNVSVLGVGAIKIEKINP